MAARSRTVLVGPGKVCAWTDAALVRIHHNRNAVEVAKNPHEQAPGQNARVELHVRLRNSHPAYIKPFDVFAKWDFPDAERLLKRLVAQELT